MANSVPWVQLLVFLVIILGINIFALREGFDVTNSFSHFLQSLITVDPDHLWDGHNNSSNYDSSGNCHDGSGNWHDYHTNTSNDTHTHTHNWWHPEDIDEDEDEEAKEKAKAEEHNAAHASAEKTFYNTLKADINEAIKNELTSEYNLHHPIVTNSNATSTSCTTQGKEMLDKKNCPQDVQPIDMSSYIRKDSIPCWGCSM